jgi:hypothetical protein
MISAMPGRGRLPFIPFFHLLIKYFEGTTICQTLCQIVDTKRCTLASKELMGELNINNGMELCPVMLSHT